MGFDSQGKKSEIEEMGLYSQRRKSKIQTMRFPTQDLFLLQIIFYYVEKGIIS